MKRAGALAAVLFGIGWMVPAIAQAQNLEAGKSPAQLFSNTCAVCHKSARGLVRSVPPGSLPSFLREHYTTSREMAQQLAGYLLASGGTDTRGRPQEARQAPRGVEPQVPAQQQQPAQPAPEPLQGQRPPRPVAEEQAQPQQQTAPESPTAQRAREAEERRAARRELRAKQAQEAAAAAAAERAKNRRTRITPARIDAASSRGKDALPLGDILKNDAPAPLQPAAEPTPEPKPELPEDGTRSDPVPQVTPAPVDPPKEPAAPAPEPRSAPEPAGDSTGATPDEPTPPAASGPPPVPPISN